MPEKRIKAICDYLLDLDNKDFNALFLAARLAYPKKDARVKIMESAACVRRMAQ
jgi:hypothetical protein